jgi:hypothetical protein
MKEDGAFELEDPAVAFGFNNNLDEFLPVVIIAIF